MASRMGHSEGLSAIRNEPFSNGARAPDDTPMMDGFRNGFQAEAHATSRGYQLATVPRSSQSHYPLPLESHGAQVAVGGPSQQSMYTRGSGEAPSSYATPAYHNQYDQQMPNYGRQHHGAPPTISSQQEPGASRPRQNSDRLQAVNEAAPTQLPRQGSEQGQRSGGSCGNRTTTTNIFSNFVQDKVRSGSRPMTSPAVLSADSQSPGHTAVAGIDDNRGSGAAAVPERTEDRRHSNPQRQLSHDMRRSPPRDADVHVSGARPVPGNNSGVLDRDMPVANDPRYHASQGRCGVSPDQQPPPGSQQHSGHNQARQQQQLQQQLHARNEASLQQYAAPRDGDAGQRHAQPEPVHRQENRGYAQPQSHREHEEYSRAQAAHPQEVRSYAPSQPAQQEPHGYPHPRPHAQEPKHYAQSGQYYPQEPQRHYQPQPSHAQELQQRPHHQQHSEAPRHQKRHAPQVHPHPEPHQRQDVQGPRNGLEYQPEAHGHYNVGVEPTETLHLEGNDASPQKGNSSSSLTSQFLAGRSADAKQPNHSPRHVSAEQATGASSAYHDPPAPQPHNGVRYANMPNGHPSNHIDPQRVAGVPRNPNSSSQHQPIEQQVQPQPQGATAPARRSTSGAMYATAGEGTRDPTHNHQNGGMSDRQQQAGMYPLHNHGNGQPSRSGQVHGNGQLPRQHSGQYQGGDGSQPARASPSDYQQGIVTVASSKPHARTSGPQGRAQGGNSPDGVDRRGGGHSRTSGPQGRAQGGNSPDGMDRRGGGHSRTSGSQGRAQGGNSPDGVDRRGGSHSANTGPAGQQDRNVIVQNGEQALSNAQHATNASGPSNGAARNQGRSKHSAPSARAQSGPVRANASGRPELRHALTYPPVPADLEELHAALTTQLLLFMPDEEHEKCHLTLTELLAQKSLSSRNRP